MTYERIESPAQRLAGQGGARAREALGAPDRLFWVRVVFGLFVVGVLLRIFLTDAIINQFWAYTREGGAFPGKIHPGSYLVVIAAGLLYLSPGYRFAAQDLPTLRALIVFAGGAVAAALFPMVQGRNGPAGYVIDTYLAACAASVFLLAMPPKWRRIVALTVMGVLAVNSMLSIGEFASGRYILPTEAAEFRPTAFLGAALNVGVINLTACLFVIAMPISWKWKYALVSVFMMGLLVSASRTAMLASLLVIPLAILIVARLRNAGPSVGVTAIALLVGAAVVLPLALFAASELGLLDRFRSGYVDDSAQTRIDIYRVFGFVGWRDILFGTDILFIRKIANEMLGIELIESAIIFFVFDFGAIGAVAFAGLLAWLLWRVARQSHPVVAIGLLVFLALALTNNTLSTKVPSTFFALVTAVALSGFHRVRTS